MSVKRRDLVRYFEANGFRLLREGANHSIATDGLHTVPVKRHRVLDRITANDSASRSGCAQSIDRRQSVQLVSTSAGSGL
jgi:hypothetical protein